MPPFLGPVGATGNAPSPSTGSVLQPTDSLAKYTPIADNNGAPSIWADYTVINKYEYNPNLYMNGVTSPVPFQGASVSFVQLASPTLLLVSDWTTCKINAIPALPPTTCPDDWVFLWASPETAPISTMMDGETPIYRISGTYVFGHKNPGNTAFANVSFPLSPMYQDAFTRRITESDFGTGIIFANTTNVLQGLTPIRG